MMQTAKQIRLNLGGGDIPIDGYITLDRKQNQEVYPLPQFADGTIDEVRASHVLEHFSQQQAQAVVDEWARVLKPGGRLRIAVPNFDWVSTQRHAQVTTEDTGRVDMPDPLHFAYLMGGQTDPNDYHKSLFTPSLLSGMLTAAGLTDIAGWESEVEDCAKLAVSLNLQGVKPETWTMPVRQIRKKIGVAISIPRLVFSDNMFCVFAAFAGVNARVERYQGVWWEQGLTKLFQNHLDLGIDWIFTVDYDTLFTAADVLEVCRLAALHPQADAIFCPQLKRGWDRIMLRMDDANGKPLEEVPAEDFASDLTQVRTGHFGLTLLKADALRKLKRPWFLNHPDENDAWDEGRVDADIHFWKNWEECGLTLFQANRVKLGHMQLMVSWLDSDWKPVHQHINDWTKSGKPEGVA